MNNFCDPFLVYSLLTFPYFLNGVVRFFALISIILVLFLWHFWKPFFLAYNPWIHKMNIIAGKPLNYSNFIDKSSMSLIKCSFEIIFWNCPPHNAFFCNTSYNSQWMLAFLFIYRISEKIKYVTYLSKCSKIRWLEVACH